MPERRTGVGTGLGVLVAVMGLLPFSAQQTGAGELGAVPEEPAGIIEWIGRHWKGSDWGADGSENYMRPLDDTGWKARMLGMQKLVAHGEDSVAALTGALHGPNAELQILAAQTFGYLPAVSPAADLQKALTASPEEAVRLYAADALAMRGDKEYHPLFKRRLESETNRDVKKHLGYALERDGAAVRPSVIKALTDWDSSAIDSAQVGKAAPDFELQALNGGVVKLSDYRGKSPVVLVFLYGDT